jgi:hypothetical protein
MNIFHAKIWKIYNMRNNNDIGKSIIYEES